MAVTFPPYRRFKSADLGVSKLQDFVQETQGNLKRAEAFINRYSPTGSPFEVTPTSPITEITMSAASSVEAYRSAADATAWLVDFNLIFDLTSSTLPTTFVFYVNEFRQLDSLYQPLSAYHVHGGTSGPVGAALAPYSAANPGEFQVRSDATGGGTQSSTLYVSGTIRMRDKPSWVPAGV